MCSRGKVLSGNLTSKNQDQDLKGAWGSHHSQPSQWSNLISKNIRLLCNIWRGYSKETEQKDLKNYFPFLYWWEDQKRWGCLGWPLKARSWSGSLCCYQERIPLLWQFRRSVENERSIMKWMFAFGTRLSGFSMCPLQLPSGTAVLTGMLDLGRRNNW